MRTNKNLVHPFEDQTKVIFNKFVYLLLVVLLYIINIKLMYINFTVRMYINLQYLIKHRVIYKTHFTNNSK
jgi:hypothetical protein